MAMLKPPPTWTNVTYGGRRVSSDGVEVQNNDVAALVACGWTEVQPAAAAPDLDPAASAAAEGEETR